MYKLEFIQKCTQYLSGVKRRWHIPGAVQIKVYMY